MSAADVVGELTRRGETLAVAESLTGGMLASEIVCVPGASAVFRGGVVSYATDVKASVLGVDAALLAREGAVHPEVAAQMAAGVARVLGEPDAECDLALATTGVAGPDPQDGQPVGTVFVAVRYRGDVEVRRLALEGDRPSIRRGAVDAALAVALDALGR